VKLIAIAAVRFYQRRLRGLHNRQCIYQPTCSNYSIAVFEKYGFMRGFWYTYTRIKRCNGARFHGGEDLP
jgi:hypothetical protein